MVEIGSDTFGWQDPYRMEMRSTEGVVEVCGLAAGCEKERERYILARSFALCEYVSMYFQYNKWT